MLLENNVTGIQHIGIPVTNLKESIKWYESIGFNVIYKKDIIDSDGSIKVTVAFLTLGDCTFELYQVSPEEIQEIKEREHGHIDHIALNVKDIEKAFNQLNEAGFTFIDKITEFPIFENSVKYFVVLGPNGEKVEFNQRL